MSALGELAALEGQRAEPPKRRDALATYVSLLPWSLGLFLITIGPMLASLYLSFTDYNLIHPRVDRPGERPADVHRRAAAQLAPVTFLYVFVAVPAQLALALAGVLDRGMRGLAFYRSILYLPSLLRSSVAIAVLWRQIFGTQGLINQVLALDGVEGKGWISDPSTVLSTIIFFNLVLQLIHAFQSFTQAFVASGGTGGPSDSTTFYTLYQYQTGFRNFDMSYSSATAWLLLVIIEAFTAATFLASKRRVFYDD